MSEPNLNDSLEILHDLGKAMRMAEREEAKSRHGSTPDEYHRARMLGESLQVGTAPDGDAMHAQIKAVRDLPDNEGMQLVIDYHGKLRQVTMTFAELNTANNPTTITALHVRWIKELRSSASILPEPATVRGTARPVTKRK